MCIVVVSGRRHATTTSGGRRAIMEDSGDHDVEVPCALCGTLRALLHCAQHGARLCLPCDVRAHAAARWHERAPLCDGCHAAPAAAHCTVHRAAICGTCARGFAGCDAERHPRRPAIAYTGFPEPADLARILAYDIADTPPEPADTWVPDLVNIELLQQEPSSSNWHHANNINTELLPDSLIETGGKCQIFAGGSLTGDGDDDLFILQQQQDWPNLDDAAGLVGLDFIGHDFNQLLNPVNNSMAHPTERPLEAPSSWMGRRYHHPLMKSCSSEPIIAASTDAVMESMADNNAACHHQLMSSSVPPASSNVGSSSSELLPPHGHTLYASAMPSMLPRDEFPSRDLGFDVKPPPSSPTTGVIYMQDRQDVTALQAPPSVPEQASGQDTEAKAKQKEKRQEAKQRYKDKKKNRRFHKQIMYVSRKVRADTRNRVKGRFAKASSSNGGHGDDQSSSAQCGDDQPTDF